MLAAASRLAVVTLAGLVAGFAREWLLVRGWGATVRTDAFLIALFLPEAVRTILAAGVFTSSSLATWQATPDADARALWFSRIGTALTLGGVGAALLLASLAQPWLRLTGPGLATDHIETMAPALRILAFSLPLLMLHAWWAVPQHAQGRFVAVGMGSLLYNAPAIACLAVMGAQTSEVQLAWAFLTGSALMVLPLWSTAWRAGFRWVSLSGAGPQWRQWCRQIGPLLTGAGAGQALFLLERMLASWMGEGVVTAVNLARKLVNLPLMALQSLNQVVLSLMARSDESRPLLLARGLRVVTLVSLPASVGLLLAAPVLVQLLFPRVQDVGLIARLLAAYAGLIALAGWTALLARYHHAGGDTLKPLKADLAGAGAQVLLMPLLAWLLGPMGLVIAVAAGTLVTAVQLSQAPRLGAGLGLRWQVLVSLAVLGLTWGAVHPMLSTSPWPLLGQATLMALVTFAALAAWLRPWQSQAPEPAP